MAATTIKLSHRIRQSSGVLEVCGVVQVGERKWKVKAIYRVTYLGTHMRADAEYVRLQATSNGTWSQSFFDWLCRDAHSYATMVATDIGIGNWPWMTIEQMVDSQIRREKRIAARKNRPRQADRSRVKAKLYQRCTDGGVCPQCGRECRVYSERDYRVYSTCDACDYTMSRTRSEPTGGPAFNWGPHAENPLKQFGLDDRSDRQILRDLSN